MTQISINKLKIVSFFVAIAGTTVAMILMSYSKDYDNYLDIFNAAANSHSLLDSVSGLELTYTTLAYLTQNIFVASAILGITALTIKLNFFADKKEIFFIATAYYFARFFGVHDITQIRISFGIAMLVLAFKKLSNQNYPGGFLFLVFAVLSHTSTLVYVPIILFATWVKKPRVTLNKTFKFFIVLTPVVLLSALYVLSKIPVFDLISNLPDARLGNYYKEEYDFVVPNLLTDIFFYIKILALLILVFFPSVDKDEVSDDFEARCGIIFLFSLMFFIVFHSIFAIATRLADIAAPFECIVLALFIDRVARPNKNFFSPFISLFIKYTLAVIIVVRLIIAQFYLFK